jgi:hypothetical protein
VPVELDAGGEAVDDGGDADIEGAVVTDGAVVGGGVATWPTAVPVVLDGAWWPGNARLT